MLRRPPSPLKNSPLPERPHQDWLLRRRLRFSLKLHPALFQPKLCLSEKLLHHQHPMSTETQRQAMVPSKKTRTVTTAIERPTRVDPTATAEKADEEVEAEAAIEAEVGLLVEAEVAVEAVRRTMRREDQLQSVHSVTVQRCEGRGRDCRVAPGKAAKIGKVGDGSI